MDRSIKSERKTRSMRLKENCEEIPNSLIKKGHFVRNPELETINDTDDEMPKSTRKLRRHTLKEQNIANSEEDIPVKKHKQSSRTKRNHAETPDNLDTEDQHNNEIPEVKLKVKKSKKKKQEVMVEEVENVEEKKDVAKTKKKSKRRKTSKQSSEPISIKFEESNVVVFKETMLNMSNVSNASYHSAAGSIVNEKSPKINGTILEPQAALLDVSSKKTTPKASKANGTMPDSQAALMDVSSKKSTPKSSKKSKIVKDSEVNTTVETDINSLEREPLKCESKVSKTRGSLTKSLENKSNSQIKLDDTYNTSSNENNCSKIKLNDTYEKSSSIESNCSKIKLNDTDEKTSSYKNNSSKIKLNDTYEKSSSIESNCSKIKLNDTDEKTSSYKINSSKIKLNDTYEKSSSIESNCSKIKLNDTDEKTSSNKNNCSKIKLNDTYEKSSSIESNCSKIKLDDTYGNSNSNDNSLTKIKLNDTYEKRSSNEDNCSEIKLNDTCEKRSSNKDNCSEIKLNDTYEKRSSNEDNCSEIKLNDTFEKRSSIENNCSKLKLNDTYEKRSSNTSMTIENVNDQSMSSSKRRSSSILLLDASNSMTNLNNTFDKSDKQNITKSLDATFEKEKLDGTYDLEEKKLLKSDSNKTIDYANNSHISINSEDSKENLINITAELVESSNDEISFKNSPPKTGNLNLEFQLTPFKRESTYTKESPPYTEKEPDAISIDSGNTGSDICRTPDRRKTLQSPGRTPFVVSKEKITALNVTRSIEKSLRRSSSMEPAPRATKVMFCSPTNQATISSQIKRKVIKSNMKGSNKSFIFDSSVSELNRSGRKRSYTQNDADEVRSKRSKLEDEKKSVERLSRPRTSSATVKTLELSTPSKKPATKTKAENKVTRTKLPNFTALHQKQFDKMESLNQCQERKAKRARQLLTPTGTANMLERISPKEKDTDSPSITAKEKPKPSTPCTRKSKTLTLTSLNPGYTRFGFKMNTSVNPFSVPNKEEGKANESKLLPSRTGATISRREAAKQTVMREKSFTERNKAKRNESRTFIRGVRTNRRFQLQMEMRNVNMN